MFVYFLSSYPSRGCGVSRYTEELAGALGRQGAGTGTGRVFFMRGKFRSSIDLARCARDIAGTRPDVIHVQYTPTICGPLLPLLLGWVRTRAGQARIILTAHERPGIYLKRLGPAAGILFRIYEMLVYGLSHRVLVHTEEHRRELSRSPGVDPRKLEVMPHGVDEAAEAAAEQVRDLRESYGLGSRALVTSLGIIRRNKGLDHLLQAVRMVMEDHGDLVLAIAGEPPGDQPLCLDELKALARELSVDDRVIFTGYVEDELLAPLMQASQFLVLPYVSATQSGVLHREAIAFGKPVVVTDVGGLGDLVSSYGIGLVVPPADPPGLARAISRLLEDEELRRSFTRRERELQASLGWDSIARRHLDVYQGAGG